jgi:C-terminal processing protease CtpA/Prc
MTGLLNLTRVLPLVFCMACVLGNTLPANADSYQGRVSRDVYAPQPALEWDSSYQGAVQQDSSQGDYQGQVREDAPRDKGIIGVSFVIKPNVDPVVQTVFPGTPAYQAGIQPGDRIVMINSEPVKGWSKEEVDYAIPDVPGEAVTFLIDRYGQMTMRAVVVQSKNALSSAQIRNQFP